MRSWTSKMTGVAAGWRLLTVAALATIIVACGGGGMGSSASPPTAVAGPAGVSVGAITGFGSVHVNGKKFQTTSTVIHVDGQAVTQNDLHVGDVIEVKAHHDSTTNTDVAEAIEVHSNVIGPVGSIDTVGGKLVVLGQSVVISSATSFDDSIVPASLAGITVGDILRVSGSTATNGDIQATRIERKPVGTTLRVNGLAAATDATAKSLMINALVVDFSAASLSDFPSTGPKDGDQIEAVGTTLGSAGQLLATRLELRSGKELRADAGGESEVQGLVTRFASASDFDVAGRSVSTSAATRFDGGTATDLALNVRVEVEGTVDAAGVLAATKVEIEHAANAMIVAQADAVDATAGTVTALGIRISVDGMTRFEDHSSARVNTFSLADVHTGDWIVVRGTETPAGSNAILAARFERRDAQANPVLAGVVKAATAPTLTILSVNIATTPTTVFGGGPDGSGGSGGSDGSGSSGGGISATTFFTGLVGSMATISGSWDGTTMTALRASLGSPDGH